MLLMETSVRNAQRTDNAGVKCVCKTSSGCQSHFLSTPKKSISSEPSALNDSTLG